MFFFLFAIQGVHALVVFDSKETADKVKAEPVVSMNDAKLTIEVRGTTMWYRMYDLENLCVFQMNFDRKLRFDLAFTVTVL